MRTITVQQFINELHTQGVEQEHFALKCPVCGTIQSATSLIAAGAGADFDAIEKYLGFSCVGRFTHQGGHPKGRPAGFGCNWTLGGLFQVHQLAVTTPDGKSHPRFEVATPEEAQHLKAHPFDPKLVPPPEQPVTPKRRAKRRSESLALATA